MYNSSTTAYSHPSQTMSNNPFGQVPDSTRWPDINSQNQVPPTSPTTHYRRSSTNWEDSYVGKPMFPGRSWDEVGDYFPGGGNFRAVPRPPLQPPQPAPATVPYNSGQIQQQPTYNGQSTIPSQPMQTLPMQQQQIPQQSLAQQQPFYQQPMQQQSMYNPNAVYQDYASQPVPQSQYPYQSQNQYPGAGGYANPQLSQFDPYLGGGGGSAQGWGQQTQAPPTQSSMQPQYGQSMQSNPKTYHPRDYIRDNKASLDAWDEYAWKQALNAVDDLKKEWAKTLMQLQQQQQQNLSYGYSDPTYDAYIKNAQSNIDTAAASYYQIQEVYEGYKISQDPASRKRVREALNAGVAALPDWPQ